MASGDAFRNIKIKNEGSEGSTEVVLMLGYDALEVVKHLAEALNQNQTSNLDPTITLYEEHVEVVETKTWKEIEE